MAKPPFRWIKINTNNFTLLSKGGIDFLIHHYDGTCVITGQQYTQEKTFLQYKALAIKEVLRTTITYGFSNVQIETDSSILCQTINKCIDPPWQMRLLLDEIKSLLNNLTSYIVLHWYREYNEVPNLVACKARLDKSIYLWVKFFHVFIFYFEY